MESIPLNKRIGQLAGTQGALACALLALIETTDRKEHVLASMQKHAEALRKGGRAIAALAPDQEAWAELEKNFEAQLSIQLQALQD